MEWTNRRRFLGKAAALTGAVLAPPKRPSNENGGPIPLEDAGAADRLCRMARDGLQTVAAGDPSPEHRVRLEAELAVILQRRAWRPFLAAAEVTRFARARGVLLGPGRGAAPSSLVAYALGATAIDPVAHGLLFERFLHRRLVTPPTICLDVCADRHQEVLDFITGRLGGRPFAGSELGFGRRSGHCQLFADLGLEVEGRPALTALHEAAVARRIDLDRIPLDDRATYRRLGSGAPICHPHLPPGPWLGTAKPTTFEELMAALALARPRLPAACDVDEEADRRIADHPALRPILAGTRGAVLYQEQIMLVAARLAGYSPSDADLLRRTLARGRPEPVGRERYRFVCSAIGAGVSWPEAVRIFSCLERAAPRAFNRSHAVACALFVYWTAYLAVASAEGAR